MIVEAIDGGVLYGRVGIVRHICLYEPTPGARLILLVDTTEVIQRQLGARGKEINIHYEGPCFLMGESKMVVDTADISLVEASVSTVFDRDPHLPGGGVDEDYVVSVVPALKKYRMPNGGFASNTAAAALSPFSQPVVFRPQPQLPRGPQAQPQAQANPAAAMVAGLNKRVPLASAVIEEFERPEIDSDEAQ